MTLRAYLELSHQSVEDFARKTGLNITSLYRFLHGDIPSGRSISAIVKASDGAITPQDLLSPPNHVEIKAS